MFPGGKGSNQSCALAWRRGLHPDTRRALRTTLVCSVYSNGAISLVRMINDINAELVCKNGFTPKRLCGEWQMASGVRKRFILTPKKMAVYDPF